jgi:hypothetical protein
VSHLRIDPARRADHRDWTHNWTVPDARLTVLLGAVLMLTIMLLALRWTFGTGRDRPAPHVPDPDDPTGDGLLTEVSRVPTEAAAQVLRSRLAAAGIRATIGRAGDAYRLLVFPADVVDARVVVRRPE